MSFEDSGTLSARIRLFDAFMALLERPIIKEEAASKYMVMLHQFKDEVKQVHRVFLERNKQEENDSPAFTNLPPVAKSLNWASALLQRLNEPMQRLLHISQLLDENPEELRDIERQFQSVSCSIQDYEGKIVGRNIDLQEWFHAASRIT